MDTLHSLVRKLNDSKGAPKVIERLEHKFPRLVKILADGGYHGTLGDWVAKKFGRTVEVVLRPDEVLPSFRFIRLYICV